MKRVNRLLFVFLLISYWHLLGFGQVDASSNDRKKAETFFDEGQKLIEKGQYEDAIKSFKMATNLDSSYAEAYFQLGDCYYSLRQVDAAAKAYRKTITLDSSYVEAYNSIALCLNYVGYYDMAIEYHLKAIERQPNHPTSYYNIGQNFIRLKDYDNAIKYLEKQIEINPQLAEPYISLGAIYRERKIYDKSIEYYEEALKIKPNHIFALDGLKKVRQILEIHDATAKFDTAQIKQKLQGFDANDPSIVGDTSGFIRDIYNVVTDDKKVIIAELLIDRLFSNDIMKSKKASVLLYHLINIHSKIADSTEEKKLHQLFVDMLTGKYGYVYNDAKNDLIWALAAIARDSHNPDEFVKTADIIMPFIGSENYTTAQTASKVMKNHIRKSPDEQTTEKILLLITEKIKVSDNRTRDKLTTFLDDLYVEDPANKLIKEVIEMSRKSQ
jgi:tetratricopeptide (TPR) repeat protein